MRFIWGVVAVVTVGVWSTVLCFVERTHGYHSSSVSSRGSGVEPRVRRCGVATRWVLPVYRSFAVVVVKARDPRLPEHGGGWEVASCCAVLVRSRMRTLAERSECCLQTAKQKRGTARLTSCRRLSSESRLIRPR